MSKRALEVTPFATGASEHRHTHRGYLEAHGSFSAAFCVCSLAGLLVSDCSPEEFRCHSF